MAEYGKNVNQLKSENEELKNKNKSVEKLERTKKGLEDEIKRGVHFFIYYYLVKLIIVVKKLYMTVVLK